MASKIIINKYIISLFLIGCTSLLALDKDEGPELTLCAADTPNEVLEIILDMCKKLRPHLNVMCINRAEMINIKPYFIRVPVTYENPTFSGIHKSLALIIGASPDNLELLYAGKNVSKSPAYDGDIFSNQDPQDPEDAELKALVDKGQ